MKEELEAVSGEELEQAIASLPDWRREKALRFKHEQGRKECAFAYLLLCQALRETYGITEKPSFIIGEHGKPRLEFNVKDNVNPNSKLSTLNSKPYFNLSHCKNAVACVESLARHVLSVEEFEAVSSSADPQIPFTRLWTQKEAIVKLTGRGIDDDLPNLLFKYNNVSLHTEEHLDKGYILTVATYKS